jgi:integrase
MLHRFRLPPIEDVEPLDIVKALANGTFNLSESRKDKIGIAFTVMIDWAIDNGYREKPWHYSRKKGFKSIPIPAWKLDDIEQYISTQHIVADVRAVALMYYTGQRVGDCLNMRFRDINWKRKVIFVRQEKTGKELYIPIHPKLREIIMKTNVYEPKVYMDFYIVTNTMQKMSYDTLRKTMIRKCHKIGINPTPLHGLRKAAAIRMAEAGCTPHEIMSITGHSSLKEVERYTLEVEQQRLARAAMDKVIAASA